jgi:hypothetical protein
MPVVVLALAAVVSWAGRMQRSLVEARVVMGA